VLESKLINNILAFYSEIGDKTGKIDPNYVAEKMIEEKK